MYIKLHGGICCGMKHIHGLGCYPELQIAIRKATNLTSFNQSPHNASNDMATHNKRRNYDFFNEAAPMETYKARLERLVTFIKDKRPHGIIEVVITANQKAWNPILEELGFKMVTSGQNSNTHSTLYVHHLVH